MTSRRLARTLDGDASHFAGHAGDDDARSPRHAVARYGDRPRSRCVATTEARGVDLPRVRAAGAHRSVAAASARAAAGRPDPDLVAVHVRSSPRPISGPCGRGLVIVPLDLRMSPDAIAGVVAAAGPRQLILGTGRDAPDPREAGLDQLPTTTVDELTADPDEAFPPTGRPSSRPGSSRSPRISSSSSSRAGTTSTPKGVMLGHDNVVASVRSFSSLVPPMEHRLVSLLPLSHLLEQSVGLFYATSVGADIHYVRSRNPRVIFDALRERRVDLDGGRPAVHRPVLEQPPAGGRQARPDPGVGRLRAGRAPIADGRPAPPVPVHPRAARGKLPAVPVGRRVPAARGPAGLGGHRGHDPPGLWRDRDGDRLLHHARRPRSRDGRPAGRGDAGQAGRGRRDPVQGADRSSTATGTTRSAPPRRSPPTAGIGPATSATSTTTAGSSCRAARRTSSSCRTASTSTPRTSRTRCASRASATPWSSRPSPAGSRRWSWRLR